MGNNKPKRRLKKSIRTGIKRIVCSVAAIAIVMTAWPVAAYAKDVIGSRIEIEKIDGTAYIVKSSGKKTDARVGVKLNMDESLQTAAGSYVYLGIDNNKVVKVDELSQINIRKTGKKLTVEAEEGSLFFDVKEKLSSDVTMNIEASTMAMSIRGTSGVVGVRRVGDNIITSVDLLEGRVDMNYDDVSGANHNFTMWGGESTTHKDGSDAVDRDLIDITELAGFAAVEFANDDALGAKVLENSGLNPEWPKEHAQEMLAKEQAFNAEHYSDVFEEGNTSSVASLKGKRNLAMGIDRKYDPDEAEGRDFKIPLIDGLDEGDLVLANAEGTPEITPALASEEVPDQAPPKAQNRRTGPILIRDANFENVSVNAVNKDYVPNNYNNNIANNEAGSADNNANGNTTPSNNGGQGSTTVVVGPSGNGFQNPGYMFTYYDFNGVQALNAQLAAKAEEEAKNATSSSSSSHDNEKHKNYEENSQPIDWYSLWQQYMIEQYLKWLEAESSSSSSSSMGPSSSSELPIIINTPTPQPQPPQPGPAPVTKEYTVGFYANIYDEEGNLVEYALIKSEKVKAGESATAPRVGYDFPERTDTNRTMYLFEGWDTDAYENVKENLEVRAVYSKTPKYEVTFVDPKSDNPLEIVDTQYVVYNQLATEIDRPTHGSVVAYAWGLDGEIFNFKNTHITQDIKLSAMYRTYTVTFMRDESNVHVKYNVEEGKSIPSYPSNPEKEGYEFVGWECETEQGKQPTDVILKDTKFMAKYEALPDPDPTPDPTPTPTPTPTPPPTPTKHTVGFYEYTGDSPYDPSVHNYGNIGMDTVLIEEIDVDDGANIKTKYMAIFDDMCDKGLTKSNPYKEKSSVSSSYDSVKCNMKYIFYY